MSSRTCATFELPAWLLGKSRAADPAAEAARDERRRRREGKPREDEGLTHGDPAYSFPGTWCLPAPEEVGSVLCTDRTEAEVEELVERWKRYLHPRAQNFYKLDEVLRNIARQLPRGEDPIAGSKTGCVFWRGDTELSDAGTDYESVTIIDCYDGKRKIFTNRLLAFLFATSESMSVLEKLYVLNRPFVMGCTNQLCVNPSHVYMSGAQLRVCSPVVRF